MYARKNPIEWGERVHAILRLMKWIGWDYYRGACFFDLLERSFVDSTGLFYPTEATEAQWYPGYGSSIPSNDSAASILITILKSPKNIDRRPLSNQRPRFVLTWYILMVPWFLSSKLGATRARMPIHSHRT